MPLPRRFVVPAGLLALLAVAACGDSTRPPDTAPRSIRLAALPDTLGVGDTLTLVAQVLDGRGNVVPGVAPRLTNLTPSIVAVDDGLRVRALAEGVAQLALDAGPAAPDVRLTHAVPVARLARGAVLAFAGDSLTVGRRVALRVRLVDGLDVPIREVGAAGWVSSDTLVARVDGDSLLVMGDGDVEVRATASGFTARDTVHAWLPMVPTGGVRVSQVAYGRDFGCALDAAGVAYCWGRNGAGQLGRGAYQAGSTARLAFAPVETSTRFAAIAAGGRTACGRTAAGAVECWGESLGGWVSDASLRGRPTPLPLPPAAGAIAALHLGEVGAHCALDSGGTPWCWGDNASFVLGAAAGATVPTPAAVLPVGGPVLTLSAGFAHACALEADFTRRCWGQDEDAFGPDAQGYVPGTAVTIVGTPGLAGFAVTRDGTCALDLVGRTWCWGLQADGTIPPRLDPSLPDGTPARVSVAPDFARLDASLYSVCGLTGAGTLWCWGRTGRGVTPPGGSASAAVPVRFSRRHAFVDFAVGWNGVCGATADGALLCADATDLQ